MKPQGSMLPARLVGGFLPPALPAERGQAAALSPGLQRGRKPSGDHSPSAPGSMCSGGPFPPRAAPKPGRAASPPKLDEQGGTKNKLSGHTNPGTVTAQARPVRRNVVQISEWAFGPKKHAGGVVLGEPQPCCPHHLSCSILCDYKMAVKPVPRQQLAQNHLGHLILEKQRQNLLLPAPTPGQHLRASPAPLFLVSTLGGPLSFCQEQLGAPKVSKTSTGDRSLQGRTAYLSILTRPCGKQAAAQAQPHGEKPRISLENQLMNVRPLPAC